MGRKPAAAAGGRNGEDREPAAAASRRKPTATARGGGKKEAANRKRGSSTGSGRKPRTASADRAAESTAAARVRDLKSAAEASGHGPGTTVTAGVWDLKSAAEAGSRDPEAAAMALCLRLLTAAPRTRVQLEQALQRHGVPPQAAEAVLERLARARLIDDAMFAQMWVESRHHSRGLARRALSAELRRRGVSDSDVRGAVAQLSPEQEEEAARRLVAGKLAATRGRPPPARMRRLMGLLARRGYPARMAYRVVREALEQEMAASGSGHADLLPDEDEELPDEDVLDENPPDADADLAAPPDLADSYLRYADPPP